MKYHVEFENFEEYRNRFKNKVDLLNDELLIVSKIKDEVKWEGPAYESESIIFMDMLDELNMIPQVLEVFIKFMDMAIDNYYIGTDEIKKTFNEILDEIKRKKYKNKDYYGL